MADNEVFIRILVKRWDNWVPIVACLVIAIDSHLLKVIKQGFLRNVAFMDFYEN